MSVRILHPDLDGAASQEMERLEKENDTMRDALTRIRVHASAARQSSDTIKHFNAVRFIAAWAEDALSKVKR